MNIGERKADYYVQPLWLPDALEPADVQVSPEVPLTVPTEPVEAPLRQD